MNNKKVSAIESMPDSYARFLRYSENFGPTAKGLGWGSEDLMVGRLNQIVEAVISRHGSIAVDQVIDLGCGYGLLLYLLRSRTDVTRYVGVDFVGKNIEFAETLFQGNSFPEESYELHVGDFHEFDKTADIRSQIVISGLFNHKSTDLRSDHVGRARIQEWLEGGHVVYANFLSKQATRKSPNLVYTDPIEIVSLFRSVSYSVSDNFSPYEFLLILESTK